MFRNPDETLLRKCASEVMRLSLPIFVRRDGRVQPGASVYVPVGGRPQPQGFDLTGMTPQTAGALGRRAAAEIMARRTVPLVVVTATVESGRLSVLAAHSTMLASRLHTSLDLVKPFGDRWTASDPRHLHASELADEWAFHAGLFGVFEEIGRIRRN